MALITLESRLSPGLNGAGIDLRWLRAAGTASGSLLAALALVWTVLAPARPVPFEPDFSATPAFSADSAPQRADEGAFQREITGLYAGVEGPDERRYDGIDTQVITVSDSDTLSTLLQAAGATKDDATGAVKAIAAVYDPRQIGDGYRLTVTLGVPERALPLRAAALPFPTSHGDDPSPERVRLMSLAFKPAADREILVRRSDDGTYVAEAQKKKLTAQLYRASGVIDTSLFLSAASAGVPDRITAQLMYLYSYDVDFQRDVHSGDAFEVFFTRYFDEYGNPVKSGDIMFAALTLNGKRMALYRYQREAGQDPEYFDDKGRSIKKSLLRTPVESARITSGFGMRFHPILGYTRMHKGVDFGAPEGTPILASGDGTVEAAGPASGYGNYIKLRHTDHYETAYGHMQGFAPGITPGAQVKQGQVIGYVGMTGLATGPHLHYEILIDGEQVDPAGVKLDTNQPISGEALTVFLRSKGETDTQMARTPLNAPVETAEADTTATELRGSRN